MTNDGLGMMALSISPWYMEEMQERAKREEDIVKVMTVFPALAYKSQPTFEQVAQLVKKAEETGVTAYDLYHIFSSGIIPHELDTLIKELAMGWRPTGKIIESDEQEKKSLA